MLLKEAQPAHQKLRRREPASHTHDPATLSGEMRDLAVRAHGLVRAIDKLRSEPAPAAAAGVLFNLEQQLVELRAEIVRLERGLRTQNLDDLTAYVAALRQRVDEYVA